MSVCVITPSRDHPHLLVHLYRSMVSTSDAHMVAWVDEDQEGLYHHHLIESGIEFAMFNEHSIDRSRMKRLTVIVGERTTVVAACNLIATGFDFDVYGMVPDDCRFVNSGWDAFIEREIAKFPNRVGVVSSAHQASVEFVNFAWASKEWIKALGWYFYPLCRHHCVDTIFDLLADGAGVLKRAKITESFIWHEPVHEFGKDTLDYDARVFLVFAAGMRRGYIERIKQAARASEPVIVG
jgi:hypothetical protein